MPQTGHTGKSTVDRLACVNLHHFPLQLLLTRHLEWAGLPVVVVSEDTPLAEMLWVNRRASEIGIRPGMRYGTALGLAPALRADLVSEAEIEAGVALLFALLQRHTPDVEPSDETPGVFWINADGFELLYSSCTDWADRVQADLRALGFRASIVVGFTKFGTYAISTTRRSRTVFDDPPHEQAAARKTPMSLLNLAINLQETLDLLGIGTVGDFIDLPADGLQTRLGTDAVNLHRRARGDLWTPLQASRETPPLKASINLDYPETDNARLLALMGRMMAPLIQTLKERGHLLAKLQWHAALDRAGIHHDAVVPSVPTLDSRQILDLIRLRLEQRSASSAIVGMALSITAIPAKTGQATLFQNAPRRDLGAGDRALARVRAAFGDAAVVRVELRDEHLPENCFYWASMERLQLPHICPTSRRPLIRRIFTQPTPLPPLLKRSIISSEGPHTISSGWWLNDVHRDYFFQKTAQGQILWTFYDHQKKRWILQGQVE